MSLGSWAFAQVYDRAVRRSEIAGVAQWRRQLLSNLVGEVLEIGAGTGLNLEHYPAAVERLVLTEPDKTMRGKLEGRLRAQGRAANILACTAESIPVPDASFDAVVGTLVLCSVHRPDDALSELRRVLRPGGRLVFLEHVAALHEPRRLKWQHRIEPLWKRVVPHCHLARDTEAAIWRAGFRIVECERAPMPDAIPFVEPTIRGVAVKAIESHA